MCSGLHPRVAHVDLEAAKPRCGYDLDRGRTFDALQVSFIAVVYLATQVYVAYNPSYDATTFFVGAMIPLLVSISLPLATGRRVLLWAALAYFWALVDDGPVFLDSVFTWPEVTSAPPHFLLEILYHLLTAAFMVLAVREMSRGRRVGPWRWGFVVVLVLAAFGLAYFQNVPLAMVQKLVDEQWYLLDVVEHLLSAIAFSLALWAAAYNEPGSWQPPQCITVN